MHKLLLTSFAATACLLVACSREQPAEAPAADWVLTNGQIYTVDDTRPWAEAMVVKDGKFIYVGDSAGAESFISETVKNTDLGGGMVIPGIVDAHTHPGFIELEQYDEAHAWLVAELASAISVAVRFRTCRSINRMPFRQI